MQEFILNMDDDTDPVQVVQEARADERHRYDRTRNTVAEGSEIFYRTSYQKPAPIEVHNIDDSIEGIEEESDEYAASPHDKAKMFHYLKEHFVDLWGQDDEKDDEMEARILLVKGSLERIFPNYGSLDAEELTKEIKKCLYVQR